LLFLCDHRFLRIALALSVCLSVRPIVRYPFVICFGESMRKSKFKTRNAARLVMSDTLLDRNVFPRPRNAGHTRGESHMHGAWTSDEVNMHDRLA